MGAGGAEGVESMIQKLEQLKGLIDQVGSWKYLYIIQFIGRILFIVPYYPYIEYACMSM